MTTETPTAAKARSFVDTLAKLRYGQCVEDLTTELHQLLCAVNRTGRGGSITLTIKVKPVDKGASVDKVQISDDITMKAPKPERAIERQRERETGLPHCVECGTDISEFRQLLGAKQLSERDGWLFMAILKAARATAGRNNPDDYEDGAAYFALAGECAESEQ